MKTFQPPAPVCEAVLSGESPAKTVNLFQRKVQTRPRGNPVPRRSVDQLQMEFGQVLWIEL